MCHQQTTPWWVKLLSLIFALNSGGQKKLIFIAWNSSANEEFSKRFYGSSWEYLYSYVTFLCASRKAIKIWRISLLMLSLRKVLWKAFITLSLHIDDTRMRWWSLNMLTVNRILIIHERHIKIKQNQNL